MTEDEIMDSMVMSLSKLLQIVKDRVSWILQAYSVSYNLRLHNI